MHTIAVQLAPVLGAEKSKVPFYVAGGLLVAWALLVSLGIGARRVDFPANLSQQRAVMSVTAVLVLAAVATAVITSGGATSSEAAAGGGQSATAPAQGGAEAPAPAQTSTTPASTQSTATGAAPTATTGTPAPASSPAARPTSLKLAADPAGQLSYDAKQLSANAGAVTIAFSNSSPVEHNLTVAQGSAVLGATPTFTGGSKSLGLKLKPGKYTFYCSVPGHRQAGMEGTLTVS
jgi:plastocyanin